MPRQSRRRHFPIQRPKHRQAINQHIINRPKLILDRRPRRILQRHLNQFLIIAVITLHEGVFDDDIAVDDGMHIRIVAVMDADNGLVEVIQHSDVLKQHIADFGVKRPSLVGFVADFHRLGKVRPHLHVAEGDALGGAGVVLDDEAVVPCAGEAVRHGVVGAGLEGEAVAILTAGNDLDVVDFHMLGWNWRR